MARSYGYPEIPGPAANLPVHAPYADPILEVRDLAFRRDAGEVLKRVNFEVKRGECIALVGKNGSGKTTLLKHLIGIHRPGSGSVVVAGQDTRRARVSDLARHVGFVFQNPNDQLFKPNVREEIEVAPRALDRYDAGWLERLNGRFYLEHLLDRSPFTLSEGEKKRVAFAAALAAQPAILLLDEPTTGQDHVFRNALERLLGELQNEGIATVLATHDLEFAEEVAGRWLVMADGEIVADGKPESVMQDEKLLTRAGLRPTIRFQLQHELSEEGEALKTPSYVCTGE
jgi:energy-coupling factor transport system ATP-binding protein